MNARLSNLRDFLFKENLDAIVINKPENRRYFSGFTGTSGILLISAKTSDLITDFRYVEQATKQAICFKIIEHKQSIIEILAEVIQRNGFAKIGFEGDFFTYNEFAQLAKVTHDIQLKPVELDALRSVKDKLEIDDLKKAYNSKLNDIMDKKQIQELDKEKITSNDVINIAKSSKSLIRQASSDSQKIDLSGYLVSLDDLNHNTTDTVKNEIYEYLVSEYKSNKLKDKDNFYEYLYLTKYLYTSFSDVNNQKADTVFDMYQIVKDNYRNLDIDSNINQVNKSLGIKSISNTSTNKVKKHSSSYKKSNSNSNKSSNNNSSNSSIVYCNGGTSSSNKYHSSPNAHGMKGAIKMTEKQAKASGYVPCKKCY